MRARHPRAVSLVQSKPATNLQMISGTSRDCLDTPIGAAWNYNLGWDIEVYICHGHGALFPPAGRKIFSRKECKRDGRQATSTF